MRTPPSKAGRVSLDDLIEWESDALEQVKASPSQMYGWTDETPVLEAERRLDELLDAETARETARGICISYRTLGSRRGEHVVYNVTATAVRVRCSCGVGFRWRVDVLCDYSPIDKHGIARSVPPVKLAPIYHASEPTDEDLQDDMEAAIGRWTPRDYLGRTDGDPRWWRRSPPTHPLMYADESRA